MTSEANRVGKVLRYALQEVGIEVKTVTCIAIARRLLRRLRALP